MQVRIIVDAENVHVDLGEDRTDVQLANGQVVRGSIQDAIDVLDLTYERARRMLTAARKDAP